jgi:two-component system cell cycle sensor histidine kinase/response regulator CckA
MGDPEQTTADADAVSETVLLVEDDHSVRFVLHRSLLNMGYRVIEATNGSEALELLQIGGAIDLIITDVVMPDIGGFELISRLPDEYRGTKVLFMSGYTGSDGGIDGQRILDPGTHFLRKPFSTETLGNKVREVLAEAPQEA